MRRVPASGFTLLEVLVAVGIFALIGIVSAALLSRTLEARAEAAARADRLQAVQRAVQRLQRDVLQYAGRGIRDEFGDGQPPLRVDLSGTLELTVQGWRNPLELPRSELQRVRWRLDEEGTLERAFWPVLDRAQDSAPRLQAVLSDVRAFDVEVLDGEGGSWREWPGEDAADLPDADLPTAGEDPAAGASPGSEYAIALRLAVEVPPFGRIERLLLLGEAIELEADGIEAPAGTPAEGDGAEEAADDG